MQVENQIPIRIATSNQKKLEQARRESPFNIDSAQPNFDEDKIKESISPVLLEHPFEYPLLISRAKFESLRNSGEKGLIVVSDSVAAVYNEDGWLVLNRDDTEDKKQKFLEIIKVTGKVRFVGAVTFGVLPNEQPISVISFCEVPISPTKLSGLTLPFSIDQLEELKDPTRPIRIGYLDHSFNETNVVETDNFDSDINKGNRARPYISGLTEAVLTTAYSVVETQTRLEPLLRNFIVSYPFNTISYYASTIGFNTEQIKEFYEEIFTNNFFRENGGNCSLHTIFLAREIQKLGYTTKVALFPSKNPDKDNGHSAVLVEDRGLYFLLDPGLSVPYILPFSSEIPLHYYFDYGDGKNISLSKSNAPAKLSIFVESKKGRIEFPAIDFLSLDEFLQQAPQILFELHNQRRIIKVDFHDRNGKILQRISIDLVERKILINNKVFNLNEASDKIKKLNIPENLKYQLVNLLASLWN